MASADYGQAQLPSHVSIHCGHASQPRSGHIALAGEIEGVGLLSETSNADFSCGRGAHFFLMPARYREHQ